MHTINILVVDDDVITLELVSLVLEDYTTGNVDSFSKSTDAISELTAAKSNHYGLIISDLVMPDKNGLDVLATVRKLDKKVPFLMLTANATRDIVIKARKLGTDGFMAKPFATNDLLDKLDTLLN